MIQPGQEQRMKSREKRKSQLKREIMMKRMLTSVFFKVMCVKEIKVEEEVQPSGRKEKKRPVGPGMRGWRDVGRGKREKLVNGRKIKANGTVRRSRHDKRAEEETMGSFTDSKQFLSA